MCGIAAFIGKPGKEGLFSWPIFMVIGTLQDNRGKDSCGIAFRIQNEEVKKPSWQLAWGHKNDFESKIEKINEIKETKEGFFSVPDIKKLREVTRDTSLFEKFVQIHGNKLVDSKLFSPITVMAHARRATQGSPTLDNAHPFFHKNVIGVHNGGITLWKELASKLDVKISDIECDSEFVIRALGEGKEKQFLESYEGAAALVWVDLKSEFQVNIFVGEKESTSIYKASGFKETERPLHYLETEAGTYISSEEGPLEYIRGMIPSNQILSNIEHFKQNVILRFKDGVVAEEINVYRKWMDDKEKILARAKSTPIIIPERVGPNEYLLTGETDNDDVDDDDDDYEYDPSIIELQSNFSKEVKVHTSEETEWKNISNRHLETHPTASLSMFRGLFVSYHHNDGKKGWYLAHTPFTKAIEEEDLKNYKLKLLGLNMPDCRAYKETVKFLISVQLNDKLVVNNNLYTWGLHLNSICGMPVPLDYFNLLRRYFLSVNRPLVATDFRDPCIPTEWMKEVKDYSNWFIGSYNNKAMDQMEEFIINYPQVETRYTFEWGVLINEETIKQPVKVV